MFRKQLKFVENKIKTKKEKEIFKSIESKIDQYDPDCFLEDLFYLHSAISDRIINNIKIGNLYLYKDLEIHEDAFSVLVINKNDDLEEIELFYDGQIKNITYLEVINLQKHN